MLQLIRSSHQQQRNTVSAAQTLPRAAEKRPDPSVGSAQEFQSTGGLSQTALSRPQTSPQAGWFEAQKAPVHTTVRFPKQHYSSGATASEGAEDVSPDLAQ